MNFVRSMATGCDLVDITFLDAADGDQALKVLAENSVDLIITDINMPHKDGYELITAVKADEKLKHIPIVVMSVFDQGAYLFIHGIRSSCSLNEVIGCT